MSSVTASHGQSLSRRTSLATVVGAQCAVLLTVLFTLWLNLPLWFGVLLASCALALVLTRIQGYSLYTWAATAYHYRFPTNRPIGSTVDVPGDSGEWTGIRWEEGRITSVLQITDTPSRATYIGPDFCRTDSQVPMRALSECLEQHDILLDGIDIISNGQRISQGTDVALGYERLIGPLPAVASRTVWIAIRFDPRQCPNAVKRRGGGSIGATRCAVIATARVRRALAAVGCSSTVLQAAQI
ncbi:MAG: type VII secretion protein EccE, partial [Mycobacteriaceae bacterium]